MDNLLKEAMYTRHTVRKFNGEPLPEDLQESLRLRAKDLNERFGLSISLVISDENPLNLMGRVFMGGEGFRSYFVLASEPHDGFEEQLGYASSDLVLFAQTLGLNTWWIGGTFDRKYVSEFIPGLKIVGIVAVGYGLNQGVPHKSKAASAVSKYNGEAPEWFNKGVEAALLAPTALNRQAFKIEGDGDTVRLSYAGGPLSDVDKGIVKHHFELGAGCENFKWG